MRAKNVPRAWPSLGRKKDPPTSGKKPMAVSGIAKTVFSVATLYCPCTDSPAPPPTAAGERDDRVGKRLVNVHGPQQYW